ncbi:MAG TPA: hypothetical protein VIN05_00210 [Roseovarius sp.]
MKRPSVVSISFLQEEDGAVAVDWVVLTAAVTGLALAAYSGVNSGVVSLTGSMNTALTEAEIDLP